MRQLYIYLTSFVICTSCKNSGTSVGTTDTLTNLVNTDTSSGKSKRALLIEELKRLQLAFASKKKEKIADLFQFPLSDTSVSIYIDDSTLNAQLRQNEGRLTRSMFLSHFSEISESWQADQVNELFKSINLNGLLQKDSLEYEAIIKTEPCFHFYSVIVDKDIVTLTVGTNSNKDFKRKSISEDEIPENDSSICEHVLWWVFWFDGRQLHFRNLSGAG